MYKEMLRDCAVRTNAFVDKRKSANSYEKRKLSLAEYVDALKDFCEPEDLVGVTATTGCAIFNQYLKENGKPLTGRNTFSRMVKETFGMKSKFVQTDHGHHAVVFVFDDAAQR